jgi:hypothetical protein
MIIQINFCRQELPFNECNASKVACLLSILLALEAKEALERLDHTHLSVQERVVLEATNET